ncbi:MAG TPA: C40 family peptidase [Burkholderiaceae bacterium]|nr:C40 family peptidase [Burkholderiaceae bacterium]
MPTSTVLTLALAQALALAPARAQAPAPDPLGDFLAARRIAGAPTPTGRGAPELVLAALNFLDTPYRLGGNDHVQGFDCSGFTRHVFQVVLGLLLPRRAEEQAQSRELVAIEPDILAPGDLVFFNTQGRAFSHVGLYVGGGRFVHAPRSGSAVRVEDMRDAYWASRYEGARRAALIHAEN